jgi:hypothetical protein
MVMISSLVTTIGSISDGARPQMDPISTIPVRVEARTLDGQSVVLDLSPDAAAELAEGLAKHLQGRGSR